MKTIRIAAALGALIAASLSVHAGDEYTTPRNDAGVRQHQPRDAGAPRTRAEVQAEARDEVRNQRFGHQGKDDPDYPHAAGSSGTSSSPAAATARDDTAAADGARYLAGEVGWIIGR